MRHSIPAFTWIQYAAQIIITIVLLILLTACTRSHTQVYRHVTDTRYQLNVSLYFSTQNIEPLSTNNLVHISLYIYLYNHTFVHNCEKLQSAAHAAINLHNAYKERWTRERNKPNRYENTKAVRKHRYLPARAGACSYHHPGRRSPCICTFVWCHVLPEHSLYSTHTMRVSGRKGLWDWSEAATRVVYMAEYLVKRIRMYFRKELKKALSEWVVSTCDGVESFLCSWFMAM